MLKVNLFDIQRSSFVDGPGVRTTVFFKGCNLRCCWCHNPESWQTRPQLAYFAARCVQCGTCRAVCPYGVVRKDFYPDTEICKVCGKCVDSCPASARKIYGQQMDVEELVQIAMADKLFYAVSGGGVTCSGGECMLQIDALQEFLTQLKAETIHTAVDTAGNVPWVYFERLLPLTDLWLYDIKCLTPELHKELIGADNQCILENYKKLLEAKKHVIVRIPVVTGANDVNDEMERIIAFLKEYPPESVEFLPYHRMGENKGAAIGSVPYQGDIPTKERIEELNKLTKAK